MRNKLLLTACLAFLLAACGQASSPTDYPTAPPVSPTLTATRAPTAVSTATRAPTAVLTAKATIDWSSQQATQAAELPWGQDPTATKALYTPTAKPTDIPVPPFLGNLPEDTAENYTLADWDGSKAWSIIDTEPPTFPENNEGNHYYSEDWKTIKITLLREYAVRFPDSPQYDDAITLLVAPGTYWFIPANNTLEPFRAALEAAINAEPDYVVSEEALIHLNYRNPWWREVSIIRVAPTDNILGDGQPGWVLEVIGSSSYSILVLSGEEGAYHLISLDENWQQLWHVDWMMDIYDLNANGIPEIAIRTTYSLSVCGEVLQLYEWNGSGFVNLAPDVGSSAKSDTASCMSFEMVAQPDGTQAIVTGYQISTPIYNGCDTLVVQRRYEWNGSFFSLSREEVLPLEDSLSTGLSLDQCALDWVNEAGAANDEAFQLLPTLLAKTDPEQIAPFTREFGSAYLDFFRFKLGTWYAMRGQQSQALALLTQVRDNPALPEFTAASQLAEAFLQNYPSASAYAGCAAANQVLDIYDFPGSGNMNLDTEAMRTAWGFSDYQWMYGGYSILFNDPSAREDPLNICSLTIAFRLSVQSQSFTSTASLERWLNSQQIPYTGLEEGDVDFDGRRDWIVMLGTGRNQSFHVWVLLNKGSYILPLWVSDTHSDTDNITASWDTFEHNPPNDPLNVYQWTEGMVIFRVISQGNWGGIEKVTESISYYSGESYRGFTIQPVETGPLSGTGAEEVHVVLVEEDDWPADWYTLGWDPALNTIEARSSPLIDQDQQIQNVESLMFLENDPEAAVIILNQLLDEENTLLDRGFMVHDQLPKVRPYLQYLLGLAYEMSGDETNAVLAYWTLWRDFPIHPLSYVAQQKLEPVK
ncbi:MAG: hypothetical protein JW862_02085 [Anaerolineales bacterium]|nr:hypothetical protein [Anaerolineales bacterium]